VPHATGAEQAVLGACLNNGGNLTVIYNVMELIPDPSYFYESRHRDIYEMILGLLNDNIPIDLTTACEELNRLGLLDNCGGRAYVSELATNGAMSSNVKYYALLVVEKYRYRQVIERATEITTACYRQLEKPKDIIDAEISQLFRLSGEENKNRFKSLSSAAPDLLEKLDGISQGTVEMGIPSGFWGLDKKTSGFSRGDLIILAARPSMGKTALANCMSVKMCESGKEVGFIGLETPQEQFLTRTLCTLAKVDSNRAKQGILSPEEWERLAHAQSKLSEFGDRYLYVGGKAMDINAIISLAMSSHLNHPIDCLFIDYLQKIIHPDKRLDRRLKVEAIAEMLKRVAVELDIPVVVLTQLNRNLEMRRDKRPVLSDLAESGAIEQIADVVLALYRHEVYATKKDLEKGIYTHSAELIILKGRNGPTGTVNLYWDKIHTLFDNLSQQEDFKMRNAISGDNPDDPF